MLALDGPALYFSAIPMTNGRIFKIRQELNQDCNSTAAISDTYSLHSKFEFYFNSSNIVRKWDTPFYIPRTFLLICVFIFEISLGTSYNLYFIVVVDFSCNPANLLLPSGYNFYLFHY